MILIAITADYFDVNSDIFLRQLRAGRLLQAGLAPNTQQAYSTGLSAFQRFRSSYALQMKWPTSEHQIVLFIAYCFEMGYSPKTITTYLAGINYYHKLNGWSPLDRYFLAKKMIDG